MTTGNVTVDTNAVLREMEAQRTIFADRAAMFAGMLAVATTENEALKKRVAELEAAAETKAELGV